MKEAPKKLIPGKMYYWVPGIEESMREWTNHYDPFEDMYMFVEYLPGDLNAPEGRLHFINKNGVSHKRRNWRYFGEDKWKPC
jgi:hypothetical protein